MLSVSPTCDRKIDQRKLSEETAPLRWGST